MQEKMSTSSTSMREDLDHLIEHRQTANQNITRGGPSRMQHRRSGEEEWPALVEHQSSQSDTDQAVTHSRSPTKRAPVCHSQKAETNSESCIGQADVVSTTWETSSETALPASPTAPGSRPSSNTFCPCQQVQLPTIDAPQCSSWASSREAVAAGTAECGDPFWPGAA